MFESEKQKKNMFFLKFTQVLQLFQFYCLFQYIIMQLISLKVSWSYIENDHKFERTEDRATLIITWTHFRTDLGKIL